MLTKQNKIMTEKSVEASPRCSSPSINSRQGNLNSSICFLFFLFMWICSYRLPRCSAQVKNPPANAGNKGAKRAEFCSADGEDPWSRKWQPAPGKSLENPLGRGAWEAAVHGARNESNVTQHSRAPGRYQSLNNKQVNEFLRLKKGLQLKPLLPLGPAPRPPARHRAARRVLGPSLCLHATWTLSDLMDYTVHGILQTRKLEWEAFPFSRRSSQPRDRTQVSGIAGGFFYQPSHKGSPIYHGLEGN